MQIDFHRFIPRARQSFTGARRGIRDLAVLSLPQVVKVLTGFVTSIWLTRGLGPAGLGQYALVLSVSDSVVGLSDLGIGQTAIRYASMAASRGDSDGQAAVLRWAFRTRMAIVMVMVTALFFAAPFLADSVWRMEGLSAPIRMGLVISIFSALASIPVFYFQSLRRFEMNAAVQIGQTLVAFVGLAILVVAGLMSVSLVVAVAALSAFVGATVFLSLVPRDIWWPRAGLSNRAMSNWKMMLKVPRFAGSKPASLDATGPDRFALYILLSTVIVLITLRLDVWLMGVYLDQSQIGLYNAATRLSLPLAVLLGAFTTALWPRASAVTTARGVRSLLGRTMKGSLMMAAAGVLYALTVPLLAPVFFGSAYAQSIMLAQIVSTGSCVALLANPIAVVGYSIGLARLYWITNIVQLAVVVVMLVLLLPSLGALAAAITLVANNLVGGLINGVAVWVKMRQLPEDLEGHDP